MLGALKRFFQIEAASGVLLLIAAAIALAWANSPWGASYASFWHLQLGPKSLEWIVNDILMVIFFFVVGLEIRKEIHDGQLSSWKGAALPLVAALGGMAAPALLYLALAGPGAPHTGWGIPMATDIAFAVGVLTLLGKRVPASLRMLLLALAVIDDLGAILVIAFFYSSGISLLGLLAAAVGVGIIVGMSALGVRQKLAYVLPGVLVWAGVYSAGVHPTIAGVLIGLLTPVHAVASEKEPPIDTLIHTLHPWVSFAIMPVFALANAGVALGGLSLEGAGAKVCLAVIVGLLVGKPLGVLGTCTIAVATGLAKLPAGVGKRHLLLLGVVAGIGFTMSLFIAQLAFGDPLLLGAAKLGVLIASGLAIVLGLVLGRIVGDQPVLQQPHQEPQST